MSEQGQLQAWEATKAEVVRDASKQADLDNPKTRADWIEDQTNRRYKAKTEEAIDKAVESGDMTNERGEELKKSTFKDLRAALDRQKRDSSATMGQMQPGLSETAMTSYDPRQEQTSADTRTHAVLDEKIRIEAKSVATPLKETTVKHVETPEEQKSPATTPKQVASIDKSQNTASF